MNEIAKRALDLCLQLKAYGVDAFFSFQSHVEEFEITVYLNGWKSGDSPDVSYHWYAKVNGGNLMNATICIQFLEEELRKKKVENNDCV